MKNPASILLVFSLLLSGCASVGRKIDMASADKIVKGTTNKAEVRKLLGSPESIGKTDGAETWNYIYTRASSKPESFIPVIGLFAGGVNVQSQTLAVVFDASGVVSSVVSSQTGIESDSGATTGGKASMPEIEKDKRSKR